MEGLVIYMSQALKPQAPMITDMVRIPHTFNTSIFCFYALATKRTICTLLLQPDLHWVCRWSCAHHMPLLCTLTDVASSGHVGPMGSLSFDSTSLQGVCWAPKVAISSTC